jgi:hypothetical protein
LGFLIVLAYLKGINSAVANLLKTGRLRDAAYRKMDSLPGDPLPSNERLRKTLGFFKLGVSRGALELRSPWPMGLGVAVLWVGYFCETRREMTLEGSGRIGYK